MTSVCSPWFDGEDGPSNGPGQAARIGARTVDLRQGGRQAAGKDRAVAAMRMVSKTGKEGFAFGRRDAGLLRPKWEQPRLSGVCRWHPQGREEGRARVSGEDGLG